MQRQRDGVNAVVVVLAEVVVATVVVALVVAVDVSDPCHAPVLETPRAKGGGGEGAALCRNMRNIHKSVRISDDSCSLCLFRQRSRRAKARARTKGTRSTVHINSKLSHGMEKLMDGMRRYVRRKRGRKRTIKASWED